MTNKKNTELNILSKVYNFDLYKDIKHLSEGSDPPDFIITQKNGSEFGVEITEIYKDESNARIRNIPYYVRDVINTKKYRDKEDVKQLEVKAMTLIRCGKKIGTFKAILRKQLSISQYRDLLIAAIKEKNQKIVHSKTVPNTGIYNLIINDTENFLSVVKAEYVDYFLFSEKVIKALRESPYNQIYLITKVDNKNIYIPLKFHLFLSDFYFIEYTLTNHFQDENYDVCDFLFIVREFMKHEEGKQSQIFEKNGKLIFVKDSFKICIEPNKKTSAVDNGDLPIKIASSSNFPKVNIDYQKLINILKTVRENSQYSGLIEYPLL